MSGDTSASSPEAVKDLQRNGGCLLQGQLVGDLGEQASVEDDLLRVGAALIDRLEDHAGNPVTHLQCDHSGTGR